MLSSFTVTYCRLVTVSVVIVKYLVIRSLLIVSLQSFCIKSNYIKINIETQMQLNSSMEFKFC